MRPVPGEGRRYYLLLCLAPDYIVSCTPYCGIFVKDGVAPGDCLLTKVEVLYPSFLFLLILVPVLHPFCLVCPSLPDWC